MEQLKKEQRKRQKERLKAQEASLIRQLEVRWGVGQLPRLVQSEAQESAVLLIKKWMGFFSSHVL